jgi:hypothetical protein
MMGVGGRPLSLISVAGSCSRAGKTALAVTLIEALPRGATVAVKFTTTEDVFTRCPRGAPCVVCDIDVPYRVIEDPAVLQEAGTDTERLATAGARRVIWAIAKASAVTQAWAAVARGLAKEAGPVIMEGSTIVDIAHPELTLFVAHPFLSLARWKPTSAALLARADVAIVNQPQAETRRPAAAVLAEIERQRPGRPPLIADVTRPLATWAPALAARLATLTPAAAR